MQKYNALGIMSGTSLDGLDIVLCEFSFNSKWNFNIIKSQTISYTKTWKDKLSNAHTLHGLDLTKLHKEYGKLIGTEINKFIKNQNYNIDFIASHGHTIFHQPEKQLTLQIGDGAEIAATTHIKTVSDFRSLDIALGGQGAPLVPIGDQLLFTEFDYCINIGGFANISLDAYNKRIAYDICPANIILNHLAQELGKEFDKNGKLGKQGKIDSDLLNQLNNINYYKQTPPKSLAREWLTDIFIPFIYKSEISTLDKISTIYEHIASQIAFSIDKNAKVLITGGGAYNQHLINQIKTKSQSNIIIPNSDIVEFKEALIFAFLGLLRIQGKNNTLASVTGAKKDSSGGNIFI
ncbi:MAG: anhydro-N-acetylmuramic acid kinase [Bacteroidales bacterium]|nr:anhydro-N-acetylmuramic acid kinase [Bacteroidales bacterium]